MSICYILASVESLAKPAPRPFDLVSRDLEGSLIQIQTAFNPKDRRIILKRLRELLEEANEIIRAEGCDFKPEALPVPRISSAAIK